MALWIVIAGLLAVALVFIFRPLWTARGKAALPLPWAAGLAIAFAAGALGLYAFTGTPDYAARDAAAERQAVSDAEAQRRQIEQMVAGLAARLEENPGDIEGWARLGRSYMVLGRFPGAAAAYARVAEARPEDAGALQDYALALLAGLSQTGQPPGGKVLAVLEDLLARDPDNTIALFFLGQAALDQGDAAEARRLWERALSLLPPESRDAAIVRERLAALDRE